MVVNCLGNDGKHWNRLIPEFYNIPDQELRVYNLEARGTFYNIFPS